MRRLAALVLVAATPLLLLAWGLRIAWRMAVAEFHVENRSGETVYVLPVGTTSRTLTVLPFRSDQGAWRDGAGPVALAPGQAARIRYPFDSENFCWLLVWVSPSDVRVVRTGLDERQCGLPPSGEGWPCCWRAPGEHYVIVHVTGASPVYGHLDVEDMRVGLEQLSFQPDEAPLAEVLPLAIAALHGAPVVRNSADAAPRPGVSQWRFPRRQAGGRGVGPPGFEPGTNRL